MLLSYRGFYDKNVFQTFHMEDVTLLFFVVLYEKQPFILVGPLGLADSYHYSFHVFQYVIIFTKFLTFDASNIRKRFDICKSFLLKVIQI